MLLLLLICATLCRTQAQSDETVHFQEADSSQSDGLTSRLGLLATLLNKDPTGANNGNPRENGGRRNDFCCCAAVQCPPIRADFDYPTEEEDFENLDLVSTGLINPRFNSSIVATDPRIGEGDIVTRIVNSPPLDNLARPPAGRQCPVGSKTCCYASRAYVVSFGSRCIPVENSVLANVPVWRQGCSETVRRTSEKQCGQRHFSAQQGLKEGEASANEFPWTCLILTNNNDFIGGCAIIPESRTNDISKGSRRVITAAHKLSTLKKSDLLKVRILEYDASGFTARETVKHQDFTVVKFIKHHRFDAKRLSNDIAILFLDRPIDLMSHPAINAACLPACREMFNFQFGNGTGTRCWVAGWGKNSFDGKFQFIQHKVDVPIYDRERCEKSLIRQLNVENQEVAKMFTLQPGELCAGGEPGKDACKGDGGSPLVCQADSGLWYVVGLVAWGVNCALEDVPGVYVNVFHYLDFITQ